MECFSVDHPLASRCRLQALLFIGHPCAHPTDSTIQRAIYNDALATRDYATAYKAVQQVLKLEPNAPDKAQLVKLAKQLKPLSTISSTTSPTTTTP